MNDRASATLNPLPSLTTCHQRVQTALRELKPHDVASGAQTLASLRRAAFMIAEIFTHCSEAEALRVAASKWPEEFLLIKVAVQTGLNEREQNFINVVKEAYEKGPKEAGFARAFILARLLVASSDVSQPSAWNAIPNDMFDNFLAYQLETSPVVLPGSGERACRHHQEVLEGFFKHITSSTTPVAERNRVIGIFLNDKSTPYYEMADVNLLPVTMTTAKIVRYISDLAFTMPADYVFPPRAAGEKIRIGVLAKTLLAGVETFAMLCNVSRLDKCKYHLTLIHADYNAAYYSAINYYRELVAVFDDIVKIEPEPTESALAFIRNLNLDIFWHQTTAGITSRDSYGFLFSYKLARIQCAMASTCGHTTGNPHFQYFLSIAPPFLPKTWEGEFSETELNVSSNCIYIPDDWQHQPNRIVTRESLGIPPGAVIYFVGAAAAKYAPECVATWLKIIQRVPNSYLILAPLNPGWNPAYPTLLAFHSILQAALKEAGEAGRRVRLLGHVNGEAIALMHKWGDIHLSSFPYGGATTISDSLRGGLCPVCTVGRYMRNNGDATILEGYGLKDLVARSPQEYLEFAVRLGTDQDFLAATKLRVREAYAKRQPLLKGEIAASYAQLIDQIVEREFSQ